MSVIALLNIAPIMFATLKVSFTTYIVHIPVKKEEHDQIRAKKSCPEAPLEWTDYKSMAFTQCVRISLNSDSVTKGTNSFY